MGTMWIAAIGVDRLRCATWLTTIDLTLGTVGHEFDPSTCSHLTLPGLSLSHRGTVQEAQEIVMRARMWRWKPYGEVTIRYAQDANGTPIDLMQVWVNSRVS